MGAVDAILSASVDAVKRSGALEAGALMGVISAVGTDGTVTVARGDDIYPKVRCLRSYAGPAEGDRVEILRTAGGWVCLGALATSSGVVPWITATLSTGNTHNGSNQGNVQYRLVGIAGTPYMQWRGGMARASASTVFTTVPTGYRPSATRTCVAARDASGQLSVKVDFSAAGNCGLVGDTLGGASTPTWVGLSGVQYPL